jgi:DNA modification methylase
VGTGSTVVAALRSGRNGFGVDLVNDYVEIARERVARERQPSLFPDLEPRVNSMLVQGDATRLDALPDLDSYVFHYAVTSPPYWSMLTNPGSENQAARRRKDLPLVYSDDERDLGNVEDYGRFLELLTSVYDQVASKLDDGAFLTVVVKNVKRNHVIYPLAWDLVNRLAGPNGSYDYAGVTLWCQDDVGLKPFAVGIHWVSNIVHHYCLHFRRRGGAVPAT